MEQKEFSFIKIKYNFLICFYGKLKDRQNKNAEKNYNSFCLCESNNSTNFLTNCGFSIQSSHFTLNCVFVIYACIIYVCYAFFLYTSAKISFISFTLRVEGFVIVDKSVFFGYFNSQIAPSFFDNRLQTLLFFWNK